MTLVKTHEKDAATFHRTRYSVNSHGWRYTVSIWKDGTCNLVKTCTDWSRNDEGFARTVSRSEAARSLNSFRVFGTIEKTVIGN